MFLRFAFVILIILPFNVQAGLVLGAYGGQSQDNGQGIEKLKGSVSGAKIGWRWNWLALEVAQNRFNLKTKPGQLDDFYVQKAVLKGSGTDIMLRFYPFYFLSIVAGITTLDLDGDIRLTNVNGNPSSTVTAEGDIYDNGSLFGIGLHLPIGKGFEIYGEYIRRKWSSMATDLGLENTPDLALSEWHAGLTWTWDTHSRRSNKDD
jgi:hypothetical protein